MAKLAEELNAWFAYCVTTDSLGRRREHSTVEVAEAISADPTHAVTISRSYLAGLRSGAQTNPTIAVVEALVGYFRPQLEKIGMSASVGALIGETTTTASTAENDDADWRRLLADRHIQSIAMRAGTMTAALRQQVLQMMDVLDPPPDNSSAED